MFWFEQCLDLACNLQTAIRMTVGLFATEIYANLVRKEELGGGG